MEAVSSQWAPQSAPPCDLEKLHNLEAQTAHGFAISCFPHKIRGVSAGAPRAMAIFDQRKDSR
jgi:hypothetical protein